MSEDDAQETDSNTPEFVRIHSMVRRRQTRLQRYQAGKHHKFKQHILGGTRRLIRGRHVQIPWALMLVHRDELVTRWRKGLIELRLPSGEPVNPLSLEIHQLRAPAPRPSFRLDSAAYDAPQGRPIEQLAGGASPQDPRADDFAAQLAAEKAADAARKGLDGEDELEGLLEQVDKDEAEVEAEEPGSPVGTEEPAAASAVEGEGHGSVEALSLTPGLKLSTDGEYTFSATQLDFTGGTLQFGEGLIELRPPSGEPAVPSEETQMEEAPADEEGEGDEGEGEPEPEGEAKVAEGPTTASTPARQGGKRKKKGNRS